MTGNRILERNEPVGASVAGEAKARVRILVVDDEKLICKLNREVLADAGYQVDVAEDGAIAWNLLQQNRYHLLLTDNEMPNVSGMELLQKLRAARMTLPVIMASGTMPTEEFFREPALQPVAVLSKPYRPVELLELVTKFLPAATGHSSSPAGSRNVAAKDHKSLPAAAPARPVTSIPSRRILVVDDDGDTRQLSLDVLAGSGYEAEGAVDGAAGWEALQTFDYDLVITDNHMPRMTGVEMIAKLRAARMSVPVIMATGHLPVFEFARRPWLTPELALQRPCTSEELLAAVGKIIGPGAAIV